MEITWKVLGLCSGLLFCGLCNGLPINLENTAADSHTQLLTGLVAVLLTVCSVVFLAGCLCCQRRNGFKEFRDSPVVASQASNLDHGHINPVANGEFTIFTPLSPPHQNNNVFLANQQIISRTQEDYSYGDVDVSSWFNGTETDFPRIKLKYIKEIGKGWFGRVVEGTAQDITAEQKWTPVVVRILEATASSKERVVFLHDAAIYRCGSHPNILKLWGRCLDTIPLLLLQEQCHQGDLKKYLCQNQPTADKLLSTEYPLVWCCQLTSALKHLHDNKLTHPDLATRNCQLTSNLTLKLGDYGLTVLQYPQDYYQGAPGVPVRWCAPESLTYTSTTIQPKKVTSEANIWSLAVTLWEICECGRQPYAELNDDEVVSQVLGSQNVRLSRPKCQVLYTDYIFRLMQLCWTSSESRPGVAQIDLMLADLLQVHKNTSSTTSTTTPRTESQSAEDFDRRWESFKPNTIVKTDNHMTADDQSDESEIVISKPLSPSMNNLHGSLDNLLVGTAGDEHQEMESWLENVATKTGDMSYVRGLSDAIKDLDMTLAMENGSSSDSSHQPSPAPENLKPKPRIEFKLGPLRLPSDPKDDSPTADLLFHRTSSGSETEEENWKKKIERGAYSEKVRQKSRSVADLMVLTHIDPSESESETPLPSLDYRINYKNVRYAAPKQNLESVSLMFGSEGNLLNVQETFQEELRKLQEERKDNSLLFVPEKRSSQSNDSSCSRNDGTAAISPTTFSSTTDSADCEDSPSKRLLQELNGTNEIKPANQVYNVFNVTIDKYSPVHLNKLNELINYKTSDDDVGDDDRLNVTVPKLAHIIKNNSNLSRFLNGSAPIETLNDVLIGEEEEEQLVVIEPVETLNATLVEQIEEFGYGDSVAQPIEAVNNVLIEQIKLESEFRNGEVEEQTAEAFNEVLINNNERTKFPQIQNEFVDEEIVVNELNKANNVLVNKVIEYTKSCESTELPEIRHEPSEEKVVTEEPIVTETLNDNNIPVKKVIECSNDRKTPKLKIPNGFLEEQITAEASNIVLSNEEVKGLDSNQLFPIEVKDKEGGSNKSIELIETLNEFLDNGHKVVEVSDDVNKEVKSSNGTTSTENCAHINANQAVTHTSQIPTLAELIQNNDELMDYIIARYETENTTERVEETAKNIIAQTQEFLMKEHESYDDHRPEIRVNFDLSHDQDEAAPNSLTHSSLFNSGKRSLQELSLPPNDAYSSLNMFCEDGENQKVSEKNEGVSYSLETWDNFLGKALDDQNEPPENGLFDSFSSEPRSLLFVDEFPNRRDDEKDESDESRRADETFTVEKAHDATFTVDVDNVDVALKKESEVVRENSCENGTWESNGGWFLHPQSNNEDVSGEMTTAPGTSTGSYVGFNVDDEIMAAIRNELLNKLPQAQGASNGVGMDDEDLESLDRNEVFLRYNVYNTPLSPIPEESMMEENSNINTPREQDSEGDDDDSDWSEHCEPDTEHQSAQMESPTRGPHHRHTPSQDSCCSNDTLFNLEELTCGVNDSEREVCTPTPKNTDDFSFQAAVIDDVYNEEETTETPMDQPKINQNESALEQPNEIESEQTAETICNNNKETVRIEEPTDRKYIEEFLVNERNFDVYVRIVEPSEESNSSSSTNLLPFVNSKQVAPLPSPEDKPWKQLPASLLSYDKVISQNTLSETTKSEPKEGTVESPTYVNVSETTADLDENESEQHGYENVDRKQQNYYENVMNMDDIYNEADYVNIVNLENTKNSAEFMGKSDNDDQNEYVDFDQPMDLIISNDNQGEDGERDVFEVLTDIRFSGPGDSQLMTTSFSESNDLNDEQDWDSGSDTRSSSSGEFIWKEGEHEESLKALRAAPHDALDDMKPMEGIREETYSSESSGSDEEGESHEFVPSAWDKYATPTKSALRSPEKTLEKTDKKKSKGVWFKKQKYHCVYEYPREPESPVVQGLWKSQQDYSAFADWDLDQTDPFVPPDTSDDSSETSQNYYQPKSSRNLNLYQLSSVPDFISSGSGIDDEFFISSSAKPFDVINGLSSQFFPGNSHWTDLNNKQSDNVTPDSGVEDITPAGMSESQQEWGSMSQQEPRTLDNVKEPSSNVNGDDKKSDDFKSSNDVLGGLRHTRNKLKLDLPPSPSAFTSSKMFNIEPAALDPVVTREKPTFTTFGKSRFLVQHVDTPPDDDNDEANKSKNVSFEAIPYKKPPALIKDDHHTSKVEMVRGEASLLDSADEDSGIESSTLERKLSATVD